MFIVVGFFNMCLTPFCPLPYSFAVFLSSEFCTIQCLPLSYLSVLNCFCECDPGRGGRGGCHSQEGPPLYLHIMYHSSYWPLVKRGGDHSKHKTNCLERNKVHCTVITHFSWFSCEMFAYLCGIILFTIKLRCMVIMVLKMGSNNPFITHATDQLPLRL